VLNVPLNSAVRRLLPGKYDILLVSWTSFSLTHSRPSLLTCPPPSFPSSSNRNSI
jgi:hypothetical protein